MRVVDRANFIKTKLMYLSETRIEVCRLDFLAYNIQKRDTSVASSTTSKRSSGGNWVWAKAILFRQQHCFDVANSFSKQQGHHILASALHLTSKLLVLFLASAR